MTKLICIIGVTGNQGGSVAKRFLRDSNYTVRGITRDPTSASARNLAAQGIEIVAGNLDDVQSLISAFAGANLIFSVTNYWEPFFRPDCREKADALGISCRKYAYDVELQQGKNIVDAAMTTVDTLDNNGFIASTLSHAGICTKGKFTELYHFDAKADVFPRYAETYPNLATRISYIQTGYFTSSYKILPAAYLGKVGSPALNLLIGNETDLMKQQDGSFHMRFPTSPDVAIPHLAVNADMGNFVYAVSQMPPGHAYMAAGSECSWSQYIKLWSNATGVPAMYKQITAEEFAALIPDEALGWEAADMFSYSSDPGYDGGDKTLLKASDIVKVYGYTSSENYTKYFLGRYRVSHDQS